MATFTVGSSLVTFRLLMDGAELDQPAAITVEHIPGGNVTYLDFGGLESPQLKCQGQLSAFTDVRLLQSLQGQDGTLVYSEMSCTANLRLCTRRKATGRRDTHFVNLDFVIDETTIGAGA